MARSETAGSSPAGAAVAKTAIVTGAARGIGLAIAKRLAGAGFHTVLADRDGDVAEMAAAALRAAGLTAEAHALNVCDRPAVSTLFDRFSDIGVVVNNAGIASAMTPFRSLTPSDLRAVFEVNLFGVFVVAQEAVARMGKGGRIINIASRGYLGGAGASHYVASKAAVVGLTRAMAVELRWAGITVNAVAPGMVETRMIAEYTPQMREALQRREPSGRAADPDEIAAVVGFLASPAADFISGQVLMADGGKTLGMPPL